jgi:group I intron endonuclease
MEKGVSGIYKITNPKGRVYIGQSICLITRKSEYRRLKCKKQPRLYSSLLKYGFEEHIFEVIETCSLEELSLRERYWQEFYDVLDKYKGLNCTLVDTLYQPGEFSKETKEKMRKAKEGKYFGSDNPFFGKTHTPETINKIKEANNAYISKYGVYNKGVKMSEAQKELCSEKSSSANPCLHLETGIYYSSMKHAAKAYGIYYPSIKYQLRIKNEYKNIRVFR